MKRKEKNTQFLSFVFHDLYQLNFLIVQISKLFSKGRLFSYNSHHYRHLYLGLSHYSWGLGHQRLFLGLRLVLGHFLAHFDPHSLAFGYHGVLGNWNTERDVFSQHGGHIYCRWLDVLCRQLLQPVLGFARFFTEYLSC